MVHFISTLGIIYKPKHGAPTKQRRTVAVQLENCTCNFTAAAADKRFYVIFRNSCMTAAHLLLDKVRHCQSFDDGARPRHLHRCRPEYAVTRPTDRCWLLRGITTATQHPVICSIICISDSRHCSSSGSVMLLDRPAKQFAQPSSVGHQLCSSVDRWSSTL